MRGKRPVQLALFCLLTISISAHAADLYVATNGLDTVHTNWSGAYTNVQDAMDAASNNDNIYLAGHTFVLTNGLIWSGLSDVKIYGGYAATNDAGLPGTRDTDALPTVLSRPYGSSAPYFSVLVVETTTNCVLDGITLGGGYRYSAIWDDGGGGMDIRDCDSFTAASCIVTGNLCSKSGTYGPVFGGGIRASNSTVVITNCIVKNNQSRSCSGGYSFGAGIGVIGGTVTVIDTVLSGNKAWGFWNAYGVRGGGLYNKGGNVRLHNCLISGNEAAYRGSGLASSSGAMIVESCTIANNGRDGVSGSGGTVAITNSILWGNGNDVTGTVALAYCNVEDGDSNGVSGNISSDPLFTRGYYLATNSPCLNAGTNNAGYWGLSGHTTQTDGSNDSARVDMGWHYQQGLSSLELYVSPSGSDSNSGTNWVQALRSITMALSKAVAGTRVNVAAGQYTSGVESFPLNIDNLTGLQIVGTNSATTVISAAGASRRVMSITADGVRLEGLAITSGNFSTADKNNGGGGIVIRGSGGIVIESCIVTGNLCKQTGTYGITQGGGILTWDSEVRINNCTVSENDAKGASGAYSFGAGISVFNGSMTVTDTTIKGNTVSGAGNAYGIDGGGLHNWGGIVRLRNCLVSVNQATDRGSAFADRTAIIVVSSLCHGLVSGSVYTVFENCTIANNSSDGMYGSGDGAVVITNSILWGNGDDITGTVVLAYCDIEDGDNNGVDGCISVDPLLSSGYYLATNSPCVDAGTNTASFWGLDSYTTRLDGSNDSARVDMGWHYQQGLGSLDLYVSPSGNDVNPGTNWAQAFRSITAALSNSLDGTRIHIASGNYVDAQEAFPLTISGWLGVQLLGTNASDTIIDASGANERVITINTDGVRLEGLTITGGNIVRSTGGDGGGISIVNANDIHIISCVISGNYCSETITSGTTQGGGIRTENSAVVIRDCLIVDNEASSGSGGRSQGSGICVVNGNVEITRCIIATNVASGVGNSIFIGGAVFNAGGMLQMDNSLIYGNTTTKIGGGLINQSGAMNVYNCTIVTNDSPGVYAIGGTFVVTNSIIWSNGDDVTGTVTLAYCDIEDGDNNGVDGCISQYPIFIDSSTNNYRLGTGTPCANEGVNLAWLVGATDLDGGPRIKSGRIDMGCYESTYGKGTIFIIR